MTEQEKSGATRFAHVSDVLARGGSAHITGERYVGQIGAAKLQRKFSDNLAGLHYAQCRVFEAGTKYGIRTRIGAN